MFIPVFMRNTRKLLVVLELSPGLLPLRNFNTGKLLQSQLSDFDANNIFKAFFGGPGGFSFEGNLCALEILAEHCWTSVVQIWLVFYFMYTFSFP